MKDTLVAVAAVTVAGWPHTETLLRDTWPSGAKPVPVNVTTAPPPAPVTGLALLATLMPETLNGTVTDQSFALVLQSRKTMSGEAGERARMKYSVALPAAL